MGGEERLTPVDIDIVGGERGLDVLDRLVGGDQNQLILEKCLYLETRV